MDRYSVEETFQIVMAFHDQLFTIQASNSDLDLGLFVGNDYLWTPKRGGWQKETTLTKVIE